MVALEQIEPSLFGCSACKCANLHRHSVHLSKFPARPREFFSSVASVDCLAFSPGTLTVLYRHHRAASFSSTVSKTCHRTTAGKQHCHWHSHTTLDSAHYLLNGNKQSKHTERGERKRRRTARLATESTNSHNRNNLLHV